MENETFELVGKDAEAYFENSAEFGEMGYPLHEGDRVIVELYHEKQAATWMVVPEGENPGNFVPEEDNYDGVVLFLVEHDFDSEGLKAARKAQLGMEDPKFPLRAHCCCAGREVTAKECRECFAQEGICYDAETEKAYERQQRGH